MHLRRNMLDFRNVLIAYSKVESTFEILPGIENKNCNIYRKSTAYIFLDEKNMNLNRRMCQGTFFFVILPVRCASLRARMYLFKCE